jgi:hypothetical protein
MSLQWYSDRKSWKSGRKKKNCENCTRAGKKNKSCAMKSDPTLIQAFCYQLFIFVDILCYKDTLISKLTLYDILQIQL